LLNINKEELERHFREGDWEYVFAQAYYISDFILSQHFKIYDPSIKEDMKQECVENLWKKVIAGKCDPDQNLFSFFWKNSMFRILEMLRKEKNRKDIANFVSYDSKDYEIYRDDTGVGEKYRFVNEQYSE
jgi:hypothetical protein